MIPDDILRDHSPQVRAIAEELHCLIHETIDGMTERAYPGWHAIGFRHPVAGYVCGIFPFADSVKFILEHGRELADSEGVLKGDGKQVRFIELGDVAEIPVAALRQLLLEAIGLRRR